MMRLFRNYIVLLLILVAGISVYLIMTSRAPYPSAVGPTFDDNVDQTHLQAIEASRPEVVIVGDSLVEENVDSAALSAMLHKDVYPMAQPGSSSAVWYLMMKNILAAREASYHPPTVIILFRDDILTAPAYRVNGQYTLPIENLASSTDTLVSQLSYINQMNPLEKWANAYFPIYDQRLYVRSRLDYQIRYVPTRLLLKCGKRCTDAAMDQQLRTTNMQWEVLSDIVFSAESYLYSAPLLDFKRQLPHSYLPEIVRLAHENGMRLIMVRAKTHVFPTKASEPPGLDAYLADLANYFRQNGVIYVDLANADIPAKYFVDLVHMSPEGKIVYTEALGEALAPLFR
jgi:hypothetical protein